MRDFLGVFYLGVFLDVDFFVVSNKISGVSNFKLNCFFFVKIFLLLDGNLVK